MNADAARLRAIEDANEDDFTPPCAPGAVKIGARKVPLKRPEGPPEGWQRPRWWHRCFERIDMCYLLPKFVLEGIARAEFPDEYKRAPPKRYQRTPEQKQRDATRQHERRSHAHLRRRRTVLDPLYTRDSTT